ncbi:MAG: GTP-binding protein [Desulfomicrobium escambiense]|nr:GTP-binding protein [Desulfomicrobium escambiense]
MRRQFRIEKTQRTSASWPTSMRARPRLPSVSSSIRGGATRSARCMTAQATMDWMEQEKERGITITSAATTCFWKDHMHQHHRHARPRGLHHRGGAVPAGARRRRGGLLRRRRRRASVRDGLAAGRAATRCPGIAFVNKMDRVGRGFPERRGPDQGQARRQRRCRSSSPWAEEEPSPGVIDLVEMKAVAFDETSQGRELSRDEIPAELQETGRGVPRDS